MEGGIHFKNRNPDLICSHVEIENSKENEPKIGLQKGRCPRDYIYMANILLRGTLRTVKITKSNST